ncbi:MAG: hypothetical protein JNK14_08700 [Chitinophagaceae bacterium]|nr:hypothetical protein [Chitinophagaceae bacterium]
MGIGSPLRYVLTSRLVVVHTWLHICADSRLEAVTEDALTQLAFPEASLARNLLIPAPSVS